MANQRSFSESESTHRSECESSDYNEQSVEVM